MTRDKSSKFIKTQFSKMTFACLSQATATSNRVFHQTQNTFNRIQNTFITDEIHDQGKIFISEVTGTLVPGDSDVDDIVMLVTLWCD